MVRESEERHRRSIRLRGFNYARRGSYFVTVCTRGKVCLFGEVRDGRVRLNRAGRVAEACWLAIPEHFPHVELDAYVVMPNHVHGIIRIAGEAVDVGINDARAAEGAGGADAKADEEADEEADEGADEGADVVVGAKNFSPLPASLVHGALPPNRGIPPKGMGTFRSPSKTVGSIVRGFKIGVTHWFRTHADRRDVWQRNYYEHIVRDAQGLERIRRYIAQNPARWGQGRLS